MLTALLLLPVKSPSFEGMPLTDIWNDPAG
jgi:hypothetical protein